MSTYAIVRRVIFLVVLSTGIGQTDDFFGAEVRTGGNVTITITNTPNAQAQVSVEAKVDTGGLPRELAMRPLAAYRIQPPDIIQIEIISAKDGKDDESKPATKTEESKPDAGKSDGTDGTDRTEKGLAAGGAGAVSGGDSLTKKGTATLTVDGSDTVTFTDDKNTEGGQSKTSYGTVISSGTIIGNSGIGRLDSFSSSINSPTLVWRGVNSGGVNSDSGSTAVLDLSITGNDKPTYQMDIAGKETDDNKKILWGSAQGGKLTVSTTVSGGLNPTGVLYLAKNNNLDVRAGRGYLSFNPANLANMPRVQKTARKASAANLVAGQYLVGPDGTINLRQYGMVQIMGMTIAEANEVLEAHLSKYFDSVEVSVNVLGYNSQVFYIITDGAGSGDNVRRIPITGHETVLDAIASVGGLSQFSSKKIWISRPSETNPEKGTILPVDYDGIVKRGATATNYQIMPGDRIFIEGDRAIALNTSLGKKTAPVERILGLIGLGTSVIRSIENILPKDSEDLKFDFGE